MAVQLSISIEGENQLRGAFESMGNALKSFREPLADSTKLLKKTFDTNFNTKGSTIGEPWQPRKRQYPWAILQKTGKMRKSFRDRISSFQAEIFNTAPYFKYHQSNKPRKKLPRRVMMKIDLQRGKEIIKIFNRYLDKKAPMFKK